MSGPTARSRSGEARWWWKVWQTGRALLFPLSVAACYSYVPIGIDSLTPREEVRVQISGALADRLSLITGKQEAWREAEFLAAEGQEIRLRVFSGMRERGFHLETMSQTVILNVEEIEQVERKELDRLRTAGLVSAVGIAVGALVWDALRGRAGGTPSPPGPDGPAPAAFPRFHLLMPD